MGSGQTIPVGVDFVHRVQSQNPFLVNTEFPVLIGSRLSQP